LKVLIFLASTIFLLFNTDTIYTSLNGQDKSDNKYSPDLSYSAFTNLNENETQNEEVIFEVKTYENSGFNNVGLDEDVQNMEDGEGEYVSDDNPVTWDEDAENYPLETPDTYENVDDEEVQSPTHYKFVPEGACAVCGDGTFSFSKNRRGTCSHHGGVAKWLR
jgi:Protein of unknown function (DUF3761)